MQIWILASFVLGLMLFGGLFFHGRGHVLGSLPSGLISNPQGSNEPPAGSPKVVIIIPVTGNASGMKVCLESLLDQDYPNYETFFVTRDMEDPGASIIQELLSDGKNARHIISGPATCCGQKNQNLLAGVAAAGPSVEILVFCDSSHQAPQSLLSDLIRPVAEGNAVMTTGFHRIVPGDFGLGTLGMLWSVLGIHLLQGITVFTQPWGGAMAIRRTVFETHGVDRLWARTVVDDFSMGPHLRRKGIRCKPVPTACLTTPLAGQTLYEWNTWLTRQLLYLKFYTPGSWLAAALAAYLLVGPILLAGMSIIGGFFRAVLLEYVHGRLRLFCYFHRNRDIVPGPCSQSGTAGPLDSVLLHPPFYDVLVLCKDLFYKHPFMERHLLSRHLERKSTRCHFKELTLDCRLLIVVPVKQF